MINQRRFSTQLDFNETRRLLFLSPHFTHTHIDARSTLADPSHARGRYFLKHVFIIALECQYPSLPTSPLS